MPKAPSAPPAQWTPMVLPYKGIDRSVVHALRPPGTTDFAENVRLTCPRLGRKGLARRSPFTKLWDRVVGDSGITGGNAINHLACLPKRGEAARAAAGRYIKVTDDFVGLLQRDTAGYASDLNRRTNGTNRDLVGFRRNYHGGSPHYVSTFVQQRVQSTVLDGSPDFAELADGVDGGLVVSWKDSSAGGYPGVAIQYPTSNDVTVQMYANGKATTGGNSAGAIGEGIGYGPFIRGSEDLSQCIGACLIRTGADKVKLSIIKINGATRTTLAQSDELTLDAGAWGSTYQTTPDLFIRIFESASNIRAVCAWQSQGIGNVTIPDDVGPLSRGTVREDTEIGGDTGGGGGGAGTPGDGDESDDIRLTCSTSDTSFLGENRAGMAALFTSGGTGSAASVDDRWYIRSITYTKFVPTDPVVIGDADRNSGPLFGGIQPRYYVPFGCTAVGITTGGTFQSYSEQEVGVDGDLTGVIVPYKDQHYPIIKGNTAVSRSSYIIIGQSKGSAYSGRPQVEVRGRYDALGLDSGSDTEDIAGAALRVYSDLKSCILVEVMHGASTGDETDPYLGKAHQDNYTTIRFVGVANGARTVLETYTMSGEHAPPFHASNWQRWQDNGESTLSTMTVSWKINGITLRTFPALSSMSGWGTFSTAINALAGRVAYMNTSKLCGISFRGDDAPPPNLYCWGGRIINPTGETTVRTLGVDTSILIAFTPGRITIGEVSGGTPYVPAGGTNLLFNAGVRTAFLGPILYITDGTEYFYMDASGTQLVGIPKWVADTGTLPVGCRLICSWRGSIVLARQDADTTAYFISDVLNPFGWDYGADPQETSAFAGASSAQGQPAQPIVALMSGPDDILYFGCLGQILAMQGDPRTGGQLVVAEPNIGVLGPDAWCFDDKGNLYFVSGSGLYRIPRGGVGAQNIDQDRMGPLLTDIDGSTTQIHLHFNPVERCVYIFRTPVSSSTAARHIVYDVEADAFVEDRYDGGDGTSPEMNPYCAVVPLSSVPGERVLYTGGSDGWVRRMNVDADNDERTATTAGINAQVDIYAPDSSGVTEVMIEQLRLEGATGSGTVTIRWFVANAQAALAEQVVGDAVLSTTRALAGYCTPISIRRRGAAQKLRISMNTSGAWFLVERVAMSMSSRGRRR